MWREPREEERSPRPLSSLKNDGTTAEANKTSNSSMDMSKRSKRRHEQLVRTPNSSLHNPNKKPCTKTTTTTTATAASAEVTRVVTIDHSPTSISHHPAFAVELQQSSRPSKKSSSNSTDWEAALENLPNEEEEHDDEKLVKVYQQQSSQVITPTSTPNCSNSTINSNFAEKESGRRGNDHKLGSEENDDGPRYLRILTPGIDDQRSKSTSQQPPPPPPPLPSTNSNTSRSETKSKTPPTAPPPPPPSTTTKINNDGAHHRTEEEVQADKNSKRHPCMWSISYKQLMKVETLAKKTFRWWYYPFITMRDINEKIIQPWCRKRKKSYALSHNRSGLKIDAFITHCWDEPFADFLKSIRDVFKFTPDKPNLWICAFALRQEYQYIQNQLNVPLQDSPFVQALREANTFVVVRNSKVDLYSRAWCVAELHFANKFQFTRRRQGGGGSNNKTIMVTGPNQLKFSNLRTSCKDAMATMTADADKIRKELNEEQGNLEAIDQLIQQYRDYEHDDQQGSMYTIPSWLIWLVVIVIVLAVFVRSRHNHDYTTTTLTLPQSPPGGPQPTQPSYKESSSFLPESYQNYINQHPGSHQATALAWTMKHSMFSPGAAVPEWRKRQLFGLMSVYYSAQLDLSFAGAINNSSIHECEWKSDRCIGMQQTSATSAKECGWWISCSKDGRIEKLIIQPNALIQGSIPPQISLLSSNLREFKLLDGSEWNNLQESDRWSLPTELGLLTNLESFHVIARRLTGVIPSELFGGGTGMTALKSLSLRSHVWLKGTIPTEVGLATSLISLQLRDNQLHGSVPSELGRLTRLHSLVINNNRLSGTIPKEICRLPTLQTIRIDCNRHPGKCCDGDPKCRCSPQRY